ncbi:MAG: hypothetical protein QOF38_5025 [Pseudonocardiales bacterium]|nr:hypothetical protein [Pseudonocardiales bacterium]
MRDGRADPATADRQPSRARWQIVTRRALEAAQNRKYADMGLPHEGLLGRATVCTLWRNASDAPLANATPHVVVPQYEGARRTVLVSAPDRENRQGDQPSINSWAIAATRVCAAETTLERFRCDSS